MRRLGAFAFASAILATAGTARPDALPTFLNILGSVTNAARPVANALVIALNLNNLEASQTFSRADGSFTLPLLPAGVYKIIAVNQGFSSSTTTVIPDRQDHRFAEPSDDSRFGTPIAESSAMQMELRSSPTEAVRVGSTKAWWRYRNEDQQQADIRSHNIEWEHGDARLQVRYLAQQNLFLANPGSDLIEIAGNTTLMQTQHSDFGIALRVTQESMHNTANATFRTADLTASSNLEIVPSFSIRYGMSSRLGLYGTEWAPRTGAEWKLTKDTALVASGLYKVYDQERPNMMPSI